MQFEKQTTEDFGLDDFLSTVKEGAKKRTAEGYARRALHPATHTLRSNDDSSKRRK